MAEDVLTVLRAKRDAISEQVHDTNKKLAKLRTALANLDAAIGILSPDHPDYIAPAKPKKRYFRHNELARLVRATLRDANRPLSAGEIAAAIMVAKGLTEAHNLPVTKMVVSQLGAFARDGVVTKTGKTRDARRAHPRYRRITSQCRASGRVLLIDWRINMLRRTSLDPRDAPQPAITVAS